MVIKNDVVLENNNSNIYYFSFLGRFIFSIPMYIVKINC